MKLSRAQMAVIRCAAAGEVRPAKGWEVHASFGGFPTWYGVPRRSHERCVALGLLAGGRLTDAGAAALREIGPAP